METEELIKKRLEELARKAYRSNTYTFTGFLGLSELASFYEMEKELAFIPASVFGGGPDCERAMIRFGSEELFGYEEEFPIVCLKIKPLVQKFADKLGHRDFLGALMNLGIDRGTLGDILIEDNTGYLFCLKTMAPFIEENLTRICHTAVLVEKADALPETGGAVLTEKKIQIASERIDCVIAGACHLSRSESLSCFQQKRVFLNGRLCENNSSLLKKGDTVTLRGTGKFIFEGSQGLTRKGKQNAVIRCYGS